MRRINAFVAQLDALDAAKRPSRLTRRRTGQRRRTWLLTEAETATLTLTQKAWARTRYRRAGVAVPPWLVARMGRPPRKATA